MFQNTAFLVVKSKLALGSPGCWFICRHHAKIASYTRKCDQIQGKTIFQDTARQTNMCISQGKRVK